MLKASLTLQKAAFLLVTDLTDYINDLIYPHASAADTVLYPPLIKLPHVLNCASPLYGNSFTRPARRAGESASF
jgi:hypothetical protein